MPASYIKIWNIPRFRCVCNPVNMLTCIQECHAMPTAQKQARILDGSEGCVNVCLNGGSCILLDRRPSFLLDEN